MVLDDQVLASPRRGVVEDPLRLGVDPLARDDVGPVAVHADQQGYEDPFDGVPDGRSVDDGAARHLLDPAHQPQHLGTRAVATTSCFEAVTTSSRVSRAPETRASWSVSGCSPSRVHEQRADPPQQVVAGGAGGGPVLGQPLVALEDLLDDDPRVVGRLGQPAQVAARVGEAVRVVDPQPVDRSGFHQVDQERVRGVEHLRVLDPHRRQRAHVEEPAVVQRARRRPPGLQSPPLPLEQLGQRQLLRARSDRQLVGVVADDGLVAVRASVVRERSSPDASASATVLPRTGITTRSPAASQSTSNHDA